MSSAARRSAAATASVAPRASGRRRGLAALASAAGEWAAVSLGHLRLRADAPAAAPAKRVAAEQLEPRRLLATILSGETLFYSTFDYEELPEDADDFVQASITVTGGGPNTAVVAFGATSDGRLADLSGNLDSDDPDRAGPINGGVGGTIGVQPLVDDALLFTDELGSTNRPLNVTDYVGSPFPSAPGSAGVLQAPQDNIAFNALAANSDGRTIAAQLIDVPVGDDDIPTLQLAEINLDLGDSTRNAGAAGLAARTNVGDALFFDDILGDVVDAFAAIGDPVAGDGRGEQLDSVNSIVGASFSPGDNDTLYLGVNVQLQRNASFPVVADDPRPTEVFAVVAVDLSFGAGTIGVNSVGIAGTDFFADEQVLDAQTIAQVNSFAAVGGGGLNPTVVLHGTFNRRLGEATAQQRIESVTGLVQTTATLGQNISFGSVTQLTLFGEAVTPTRLALRPGTDLGGLYGITEAGEDAQLFQITGNTLSPIGVADTIDADLIGGLRGTDGGGRGTSLESLAWVPTLANRFTDGNGTFVSFDTGVDEVVVIDQRPRGVGGALSLYNLTVVNGTPDTAIVITAYDDEGNATGFSGDAGDLINVGGEEDALAIEGGDYGELYLGMKFSTEDDVVITYESIDIENATEGTPDYSGLSVGGEAIPGLTSFDGGLGTFLYGGVVTGAVRIEGSLGFFAAGSILTGNVNGSFGIADNFAVFGDVGSVVSLASIGDTEFENAGALTERAFGDDAGDSYTSGADFAIGGRLGSVQTPGSVVASFEVRGDREPDEGFEVDTFFQSLGAEYFEVENRIGDDEDLIRQAFLSGRPQLPFNNDTIDQFEPFGTDGDGNANIAGSLGGVFGTGDIGDFDNLNGENFDSVDYFGIGLMAGETITIDLDLNVGFNIGVGLFDPDGRLVASDIDNNPETAQLLLGAPFQYTALTGGTYKLAIAPVNSAAVFGGSTIIIAPAIYDINVNVASAVPNAPVDVTLGGIAAGRRIATFDTLGTTVARPGGLLVGGDDAIRVLQGDIGVLDARLESIFDYGAGNTIRTVAGHIRSVSGSGVGAQGVGDDNIIVSDGVDLRAAYSIGRLQATGAGDEIYGGDVFLNLGGVTDAVGRVVLSEVAAGDDIQVVDAARDVWGNFVAGRGIGSIVAGRDYAFTEETSGFGESRIFVNVDDINDDGFVDLLSVAGNVGASDPDGDDDDFLIVGGPAIDTGTNGNFRYFDVPETKRVVRDLFFGGFPEDPFRQIPQGEDFTFTDDSGTNMRITPDPGIQIGINDPVNPGTLEVLLYPVRSGGSILASLRTDRSVEVRTTDRGDRAVGEIGNLYLASDNGRPLVQGRLNDGFGGSTGFGLQDAAGGINDPTNGTRLGFSTSPITVGGGPNPTVPGGGGGLVDTDGDGVPDASTDSFLETEVTFGGRNLDVLNVQVAGLDAGSPVGDGRLTRLVNESDGELLGSRLTSVGLLRGERIGVSSTRGFAELKTADPLFLDAYPFDREAHVMLFEGSVGTIEADTMGNIFVGAGVGIGAIDQDGSEVIADGQVDRVGTQGDGIGNTIAAANGDTTFVDETLGGVGGLGLTRSGELTGVIGEIRADAFGGSREQFNAFGAGRDRFDRFEGIVGPIVAGSPGTDDVLGEIRLVDVGEGIADEGSGRYPIAGLYAEAFITDVVANDADIRGEIVAQEINRIRVNGGSIIGTEITQPFGDVLDNDTPDNIDGLLNATTSFDFASGQEVGFGRIRSATENADLVDEPVFEIDSIEVSGGGLLDVVINGTDLDTVRVDNGFGILRSSVSTSTTDGVLNRVTADGLGIRNTNIVAGTNINTIEARGDASLLNVVQFPASARPGDLAENFDPATGSQIGAATDIRRTIGLPADVNIRQRITNTGVIENVTVTAARDLGSYSASVTRSNFGSDLATPEFVDTALGIGIGENDSPLFPNRISVGRNLGSVNAISTFGFQTVAGALSSVDLSRDMLNTNMRVSGEIDSVDLNGAVDGASVIRAEGPDGVIRSVRAGEVFGTVRASTAIDEIVLVGDLGAPLGTAVVLPTTEANIRAGGAGEPNAPIRRLIVGGDVLTGTYVRATDQIDELVVRGDVQAGAVIQATSIDDITVDGNVFGDILAA